MLPASNRGAGQNMGFPDPCLTPAPPAPPVPIPYPNIAMNAQAVGFSPIVKVSGVNALNLGSMIPMTSGDEGGVAHPMIKGMGKYTMGNPIVSIDKLPAINLTCPTTGNNMNNGLGAVLVPSAVNVMMCLAQTEVAELGDLMASRRVRADLLPGGVALVRVPLFVPGVSAEVFARVAELDGGLRATILDLRGNPGGDLDGAIALAEDFLPEDAVVARLVEPDGDERVVAARGGRFHAMPLVLLVDRATASAAELLTIAMQANGRASVLGERTYGKWVVQRVAAVGEAGACVRVHAGRFGRDRVDGIGAVPDLEVRSEDRGAWVRAAWAVALAAAGSLDSGNGTQRSLGERAEDLL